MAFHFDKIAQNGVREGGDTGGEGGSREKSISRSISLSNCQKLGLEEQHFKSDSPVGTWKVGRS